MNKRDRAVKKIQKRQENSLERKIENLVEASKFLKEINFITASKSFTSDSDLDVFVYYENIVELAKILNVEVKSDFPFPKNSQIGFNYKGIFFYDYKK